MNAQNTNIAQISHPTLAGSKFNVRLAKMKILLDYKTDIEMHFTIIDGGEMVKTGYSETVPVKVFGIKTGLFVVGWKEKSGATVSHVEDLENQILYSNITMPDGNFYNLIGSITSTDEEFIADPPQVIHSEALQGKELQSYFDDFSLFLTFTKNNKIYIKKLQQKDTEQAAYLIDVNVTEIRANIFMVTFKEQNDDTITQVFDLAKEEVWINITKKDGRFLSFQGKSKTIQH